MDPAGGRPGARRDEKGAPIMARLRAPPRRHTHLATAAAAPSSSRSLSRSVASQYLRVARRPRRRSLLWRRDVLGRTERPDTVVTCVRMIALLLYHSAGRPSPGLRRRGHLRGRAYAVCNVEPRVALSECAFADHAWRWSHRHDVTTEDVMIARRWAPRDRPGIFRAHPTHSARPSLLSFSGTAAAARARGRRLRTWT